MSKSVVARLLDLSMRVAAEEEEAVPGGGGGKMPGGQWIEFMKEEGDKTIKNPDTGNTVKFKSLKGDKGKKLLRKKFEQWDKRRKQKEQSRGRARKSMRKKSRSSTTRSVPSGKRQWKRSAPMKHGRDLVCQASPQRMSVLRTRS